MPTREEIYDTKIHPLMDQIIAICKENDIPIVASFDLDDERDNDSRPGLKCSTSVVPCNASPLLRRMANMVSRAIGEDATDVPN